MNIEKIDFGDSRDLIIIDGAVTSSQMVHLYYLCCQLPYRITNSSTQEVQSIVDRRLKCDLEGVSPLTDSLFKTDSLSEKTIKENIDSEKYLYRRTYVNLGIHSDVNQIHTDNSIECKTLLYYANKVWDRHWGGQTVFLDDYGASKKLVDIVPGRIVIFDGRIPHTVMPMNIRATPSYRFTVACKFELKEDEE